MVEYKILIIIQDNRGKISLVQYADVDEAKHLALGESIFCKYLYQELRINNILHLTQYTVQSSTYTLVSMLDS